MSDQHNAQDPLEFVSKMWNNMGFSLPGMVTPTLDMDELDKRIHDLKAVEHWLKMNLNMLQMTTQGLEMQRAALAAVKAMSEQASEHRTSDNAATAEGNPFAAAAAMWPWNLMQGQTSETATPASTSSTRSAPEPHVAEKTSAKYEDAGSSRGTSTRGGKRQDG